jgi:predicted ribosomally synthesized peptide with nif11-like leader
MIDDGTIAFLEKANEDTALQAEIEAAVNGATDKTGAVVALAASKGFTIDREGFDEARRALARAATESGALSERELEGVAGGFNPQPEPPARVTSALQKIQYQSLLFGW